MINNNRLSSPVNTLLLLGAIVIGSVTFAVIISWLNDTILFLSVFGLVILVALIFLYPDWTLPAVIGIWGIFQDRLENYTVDISAFGTTLNASRVIGLVITFALILTLIIKGKIGSLSRLYPILLYLPFIFWTFLQGLLSDLSLSVPYLFRFFSETTMFIGFALLIRTEKQLKRVSVIYVVFGFIMALFTILFYLSGRSFLNIGVDLSGTAITSSENVLRSTGSFGGPFVTSTVLVVILAHALALWKAVKPGFQQLVLVSVWLTLIAGIFVTVTRTSIISAFIIFIIWIILQKPSPKAYLGITSFLVLAGVLSVNVIGLDSLISRSQELVGGLSVDQIGSGRIGIWTALLGEFYRQGPFAWLTGAGYGFSYIGALISFGIELIPHNQFLWLLTDFGALGLFFYLIFLGGTIFYITQTMRSKSFVKTGASFSQSLTEATFTLLLIVIFIIGLFWNYTGNIAFNWFFLSTVGAIFGVIQSNTIESQKE